MYDGDKLSKKETSILPKTDHLDFNCDTTGYASTAAGLTERNFLIKLDSLAKADSFNTPGSIKTSNYPTTLLLKQS